MESINALKEAGYVVVRGAVSPDVIEGAINVLKNREVKATMELETFTQYEYSPTWSTVLSGAVEACKPILSTVLASGSTPNRPRFEVGIFKEKNSQIRKGNLDTVYLTTALTALSRETGWFSFFKDSHCTSDQSKWTEIELKLEPGDVVLWYDKLARREGSGGNGTFLTATYDI